MIISPTPQRKHLKGERLGSGATILREWTRLPSFREQIEELRLKRGLFYREIFYNAMTGERDFRSRAMVRVQSAQKKTPHV
jgi:hypothetical protein